MRRSSILVAVAVLAILGAVVALAGAQVNPAPAPPLPRLPADPPAAAGAPAGFVGLVAEDTFAAQGRTRDKQLRAQAAAGVTLLRQTFDWELIERRGRYTFTYYDQYVIAAARRGIRIMPILFRPPRFHSSRPRRGAVRGTYPPRSNAAFARLARALSARYGSRGTLWRKNRALRPFHIREWQVWNEPNLPVYWPRKPSARGYTKMLVAVSKGLKARDPAARVILAGIPESRISGAVPFERYVRDVFRAGGARAFDAFAVHPYATSASALIARTSAVRKFLDTLPGGRSKQIWITEFGWATQGPNSKYTVGSRRQARYAGEAIAGLYARRQSLKLGGFVFFNWRDAKPYPGGKDFWGLHAGLLRRNGKAKPSLEAFSRAASRLGR